MSAASAEKLKRATHAVAIAAWLMPLPALAGQASDPWLHLSISSAPAPMPTPTPQRALQLASVRLRLSADEVPANDDEMSFLTTQSVACLVTGGTATLAALGFGWQNVTNLISGGVVPAAGPGAVALGLFGVVFTSFCAIGQALTPLYLDFVNGGLPSAPVENLPPRVPQPEQTSRPTVIRARALPAFSGEPWSAGGCSMNINFQASGADAC
jgi:hypothetical protein